MSDLRRQKGDLLLEIHELNEDRNNWNRESRSFCQNVRELLEYVESLREGKPVLNRQETLNLIMERFPTIEVFAELDTQQRDMEDRAKNLTKRKSALGME